MKFLKLFFTTFLLISSLITVSSCGMYKKVDQRQMPDGAEAKARKTLKKEKGKYYGLIKRRGGSATNYEFSTKSNVESFRNFRFPTFIYSRLFWRDDNYRLVSIADELLKLQLDFYLMKLDQII